MAEIRKLWSKKNSVVFVWPGEEPLELQYDGTRIVVPSRDVIGRVGQGTIYTHEAAQVDGRKVPGTAVVEDVTVVTPEGGYRTLLSIDHLCRYLTRDRDDLFSRGFNICEAPELIQEAVTLGIPLYSESQVKRAREILAREMQRQKGYKDRGETPPPSTSEKLITWAVRHLRSVGPQQQAHRLEELAAVLEGRTEAERPQSSTPAPSSPGPHEDAMVRAGATFQIAQRAGVKLNGIEMQQLLRGDEEMVEKVLIKVRARELEKQQAELQESAVEA